MDGLDSSQYVMLVGENHIIAASKTPKYLPLSNRRGYKPPRISRLRIEESKYVRTMNMMLIANASHIM